MGFLRRFTSFPGTDVLTAIEGVVIIDLPPPGSVQGVGVGTTCIVGEFQDVTYGVLVDTTTGAGNVATKTTPVEVFSTRDMLDKVGGWDETLGEFGGAGGNGFVALRNKRFSRLVILVVNNASPNGVRLTRVLPSNKASGDPTPAVLMQAVTVPAGREFKVGSDRVRTAMAVVFTSDPAYDSGVDGSVTIATDTITSAGGDFLNKGVKIGDAIVAGSLAGTGTDLANAGTFRIKSVDSATQLTLENQDGTALSWPATDASLAWRIHTASTADTGGANIAGTAKGYTIPARPLTNGTGVSTSDGTIAAATTLSPLVAPPAVTGTTWDVLSGLKMRTMPGGGGGLAFESDIQAPNSGNTALLNALYENAMDSLLTDDSPGRDVNILFSARASRGIANKGKQHVLDASSRGLGRTFIASPGVGTTSAKGTQSVTVAGGSASGSSTDASFGVGSTDAAGHNERVFFTWPGEQTSIPEAVNYLIPTAVPGLSTTDGILDLQMDAFLASVLSNLAPERSPGQAASPVTDILSAVLGFQRGVSGLGLPEYTFLKQNGVCALRIDRDYGPLFQSGITSSLVAGEKNINRRRMADFIEDSLARRYNQFSELPLTEALKDSILGETDAFLSDLKSVNNPPAQRIVDYAVDGVSGNKPELEAKGIYVVIVSVRTLATADIIVLQAEIGEGVVIITPV